MALSNLGILAQPSTVAALAPACDRLHELRWAPVPTTDKEALHQFDALLCEPPIGPECPTCIPLLGLVHAPAIAAWRERVTAQPGDHLSLDLVVPPQARVDQFMSEIVGLALVVLDTATPTLGPDLTRLDWNGRSVAINQHEGPALAIGAQWATADLVIRAEVSVKDGHVHSVVEHNGNPIHLDIPTAEGVDPWLVHLGYWNLLSSIRDALTGRGARLWPDALGRAVTAILAGAD